MTSAARGVTAIGICCRSPAEDRRAYADAKRASAQPRRHPYFARRPTSHSIPVPGRQSAPVYNGYLPVTGAKLNRPIPPQGWVKLLEFGSPITEISGIKQRLNRSVLSERIDDSVLDAPAGLAEIRCDLR